MIYLFWYKVFQDLKISAYDLNVDSLDVHAVSIRILYSLLYVYEMIRVHLLQ